MTFKAIMQRDTNKFVAKKKKKKKTTISPLLFAGRIVTNHVKIVFSLFFNGNYYLQLFNFLFVVIFACP